MPKRQAIDRLVVPLVLLAILAIPAIAEADWQEASLDLEAGPNVLTLQSVLGGDSTTVVAPHLGVRATYGISNTFAAGFGLGGTLANAVEYPSQSTSMGTGVVHEDYRDVSASFEVTARFGVVLIPTLTAGLGYQHRWLSNGALLNASGSAFAVLPDDSEDDIVGALGAGLEYRIGPHWIVGVSLEVRHGLISSGPSWNTLEIPVRVSYVFYPGWFSGHDYLPGGEPLRPN